MTSSKTLSDLKRLASSSAVYGAGNIGLRAISFFLIPLYTRYLTPADYGVMAVATAISGVFGLLFSLGLHGALSRFYYAIADDLQRRRMVGTIWLPMILFATLLALTLDRFGEDVFGRMLTAVPFDPYVRLAIWTAFSSIFGLVPLTLLQVQERPRPYVLLTASGAILNILLILYFVVVQQQGVYGYLLGSLVGGSVIAIPYCIVTLRYIRIRLMWGVLLSALAFSLPLVPHSLASWVLEIANRFILERHVALGDLGIFALGNQFGLIISLLATAINYAWIPLLYRSVEQEGNAAKPRLARLTTYYMLLLSFAALGISLFVKEIVHLMAAPSFHSAYRVSWWIILGQLLGALYYIPVNFLFVEKDTKKVATVTILSSLANVGLNLILIPVLGIQGAAMVTAISYAIMLALVWWFAAKVYPFPYEYARLGKIALVTVIYYLLATWIDTPFVVVNLVLKACIVVLFPITLATLGFFHSSEKQVILSLLQHASLRPWRG